MPLKVTLEEGKELPERQEMQAIVTSHEQSAFDFRQTL